MLGFTRHFACILAGVARIHNLREASVHIPSVSDIKDSEALFNGLKESRLHRFSGCSDLKASALASLEMDSTNTAFHWAAHIFVNPSRTESTWRDIAIQEIINILYKVRPGGTSEACLLLPMFIAGSVSDHKPSRTIILDRLKSMENLGMTHVSSATGPKIDLKAHCCGPGSQSACAIRVNLSGKQTPSLEEYSLARAEQWRVSRTCLML